MTAVYTLFRRTPQWFLCSKNKNMRKIKMERHCASVLGGGFWADSSASGRVEGHPGERRVLSPGGLELASAGGRGGEEEVRRHLRVRSVHQGSGHHQEDQAGVRRRCQGLWVCVGVCVRGSVDAIVPGIFLLCH